MREEGAGEVGGVMHCFTESREVADAALDLGFHISFSGILTFRNAADLRVVAGMVPLDRLLVETDSPYLAPTPHRGKRNQPAYVRFVANELARIRGIPFEEVARSTSANFFKLFKIEYDV
jgi:TatD DNase family protein